MCLCFASYDSKLLYVDRLGINDLLQRSRRLCIDQSSLGSRSSFIEEVEVCCGGLRLLDLRQTIAP